MLREAYAFEESMPTHPTKPQLVKFPLPIKQDLYASLLMLMLATMSCISELDSFMVNSILLVV